MSIQKGEKMKIKDTPIAKKLPEKVKENKESQFARGNRQYSYNPYAPHINKTIDAILNIDIDINEIAEIDVEKLEVLIRKNSGIVKLHKDGYKAVVKDILDSGILKWKEV